MRLPLASRAAHADDRDTASSRLATMAGWSSAFAIEDRLSASPIIAALDSHAGRNRADATKFPVRRTDCAILVRDSCCKPELSEAGYADDVARPCNAM